MNFVTLAFFPSRGHSAVFIFLKELEELIETLNKTGQRLEDIQSDIDQKYALLSNKIDDLQNQWEESNNHIDNLTQVLDSSSSEVSGQLNITSNILNKNWSKTLDYAKEWTPKSLGLTIALSLSISAFVMTASIVSGCLIYQKYKIRNRDSYTII
jgi:chaperonin cofactor prefoldin